MIHGEQAVLQTLLGTENGLTGSVGLKAVARRPRLRWGYLTGCFRPAGHNAADPSEHTSRRSKVPANTGFLRAYIGRLGRSGIRAERNAVSAAVERYRRRSCRYASGATRLDTAERIHRMPTASERRKLWSTSCGGGLVGARYSTVGREWSATVKSRHRAHFLLARDHDGLPEKYGPVGRHRAVRMRGWRASS